MAIAAARKAVGRQAIRLVELYLDECNLTYGTNPCTASQSNKCYKTKNTCHDPENYLAREKATAQGGDSNTITLASSASSVDNVYVGMSIEIVSGTGKGQSSIVSSSDGATKAATVSPSWITGPESEAPDSTSVYIVSNVKMYRHVIPIYPVPVGIGAIADLIGYDHFPTMLDESGFSKRASVTATFQDAPHHDRGQDPHVADRLTQGDPYNPAEQGTLWGKRKARNLYYQDRRMVVRDGYVVDNMDFSEGSTDFVDREYIIDRIEGPDGKGNVKLIGKDILNLTRSKKAKAPMLSTGKLSAALTDAATSFDVTAGVGSEYAASGTLIVDKEIMTFTRATDTFTVSRGKSGTTAATHDIDVLVQQCYVGSGNVVDVIEALLNDFTEISPRFIPSTDWATEKDDWLASYDVDGIVTKPTGVDKIIKQMCEQLGVYLHWDEVAKEIVLTAFKPPQDAVTVTDAANIIADTSDFKDDAGKRASTCIVYYDKIDHSDKDDEESNYHGAIAYTDPDREATDGFGKPAYKIIKANWLGTGAVAGAIAGRTVRLLSGMPIKGEIEVDVKDDIKTGDQIKVESRQNQDATGATQTIPFLVTKVHDGLTKRKLSLMQSAYLDERYAYIVDASLNSTDYNSATDAQIAAQPGAGWIAPASGFFDDGKTAYKVI